MIDPIFLIIVGVVVFVMLVMAILNRYRRCPSDKILVVYGTTGDRGSAKCVHGGGTFVWPVIQDYAYDNQINRINHNGYCFRLEN